MMADKRMFTNRIVSSDSFKEMPLSAQALYFHLGMNADDEGFLNNAKSVQRSILASDDDMKLLIAKNFVIPFPSGVMVIKHWKMHNTIQPSRLKETQYTDERSMLDVKENKAYTLNLNYADITSSNCQQNVNGCCQNTAEIRLDKTRLEENRLNNTIPASDEAEASQKQSKKSYNQSKKRYGEYNHVLLTDNEYDSIADKYGCDLRDKAIKFLDEYIEEKGYKSKSHNLAIRRWVIDAVIEQERRSGSKKQGFNDFEQRKSDRELDEMERLFAHEINREEDDP